MVPGIKLATLCYVPHENNLNKISKRFTKAPLNCGQSYKHFMIVNYDSYES